MTVPKGATYLFRQCVALQVKLWDKEKELEKLVGHYMDGLSNSVGFWASSVDKPIDALKLRDDEILQAVGLTMIYSYRRVSTDEQHNGPTAQHDAIKRWVAAQSNSFCAGTDFFDNGVSGSVPLANRPEGAKMLAVLTPGDTVVTAKLDRLFRSVADASVTIQNWNQRGIKLVAIAENFDMSSPMGKAMAQMASVFAELEREMIRSRTKAALAAKKSRGECVGEVPYGWYKDPVSGMLLTKPSEQDVICTIVRLHYDHAFDANRIAGQLNQLGKTAKKGGKWSKTQVQRVIDRSRKA